jgi:hypothetical protein
VSVGLQGLAALTLLLSAILPLFGMALFSAVQALTLNYSGPSFSAVQALSSAIALFLAVFSLAEYA